MFYHQPCFSETGKLVFLKILKFQLILSKSYVKKHAFGFASVTGLYLKLIFLNFVQPFAYHVVSFAFLVLFNGKYGCQLVQFSNGKAGLSLSVHS